MTVVALVVGFLILSYLSELRNTKAGQYGGLYRRRTVAPAEVPKPHYVVVKEGQVSESSSADPLLLETARKEQMLGVTSTQTVAPALTTSSTIDARLSQQPRDFRPLSLHPDTAQHSSRFKITGGAEGVTVAPK